MKYRNGQVILKEGENTHNAYIIMTGNVNISNNGVNIASQGENEIFGEHSWLQHPPRSATVTAQDDQGTSEQRRRNNVSKNTRADRLN